MQKLNEIKHIIKLIESSVLDDVYLELEFNKQAKLEDLIQIRKALIWVIQSQPRKKKDDKSKKLEDFDVGNPLLKIIPKQPKVPVEMYTTTT